MGRSFHNIGIAEICEKADLNRGSFYHFFPSKLDLLLEVMETYITQFEEKFAEIAASKATPERKIRNLFVVPQKANKAWKAVHGTASGCFLGNMILELAGSEPLVRKKSKHALQRWGKAIEPIVAEYLVSTGNPYLDVASAAEAIIGLQQGANVLAKAKNDPGVLASFGVLAIELLRPPADPHT
jgi:TetR/AcrR family transcriptional regulator, transcriptional repressor for nem operon